MGKQSFQKINKSKEALKKAGNRTFKEIIEIIKSIREETIKQNQYNERFL